MAMRCFCPPERLTPRCFDVRVVALGQLHDEVVRLGGFGGGDDLFVAGIRAAVADVVAHRAGEQDGLLGHDPDLRQERVLLDLADIDPVDQHPTCW